MIWMLTVLWVVMLLAPLALLYALLPSGRDCPRCASETLAIRSRMLRPVRRWVARRWCIGCGWEGMARYPLRHHVPAQPATAEPHPVDDDAAWRGEKGTHGL